MRLGRKKNLVASPGLVAPSRKNLGFAGGDGMVWYGMLLLLLLLWDPARAGGRNCQTGSPWAGRKEQSAGVTLARLVRTTTDGGGGSAFCLGREGARVAVTGTTCGPPVGRRRVHLCKTGAGWGAGWREHLSGDLRGPGSPCLGLPPPRDWGGGYVVCGGGVRGWRGRGLCMVYSCAWAQQLQKGRRAGLRWRAARGYAGAQCGTGQGRNTGPRRRTRCCVGAWRGSAMQRSMRLRRGRSVGPRRAHPAAVLESPVGQG